MATPHHHPLPVEGRAAAHPPPLRCAPARIRPDLRTNGTHGHARRSGRVCSAARVSQLRQRVAPGSAQPASPSVLRGGRTRWLRRLPLAALRIHSLRSGHGLMQGKRAQVGSAPRGGAHSATADGLLHFSVRPRVVVGCGPRPKLSRAGAWKRDRSRRRPRAPACAVRSPTRPGLATAAKPPAAASWPHRPDSTRPAQSREPGRACRVASAARAGADSVPPRVGAQLPPRLRSRSPGRHRPSPWEGVSARRRGRRLLRAAAPAPRHPVLGYASGLVFDSFTF